MALVRLDKALTATFDANVAAGRIAVTTAEMQQAVLIRAINATTVGRTVTLPGVARVILLHDDAANTPGWAGVAAAGDGVMTALE